MLSCGGLGFDSRLGSFSFLLIHTCTHRGHNFGKEERVSEDTDLWEKGLTRTATVTEESSPSVSVTDRDEVKSLEMVTPRGLILSLDRNFNTLLSFIPLLYPVLYTVLEHD